MIVTTTIPGLKVQEKIDENKQNMTDVMGRIEQIDKDVSNLNREIEEKMKLRNELVIAFRQHEAVVITLETMITEQQTIVESVEESHD